MKKDPPKKKKSKTTIVVKANDKTKKGGIALLKKNKPVEMTKRMAQGVGAKTYVKGTTIEKKKKAIASPKKSSNAKPTSNKYRTKQLKLSKQKGWVMRADGRAVKKTNTYKAKSK